MSKYWLYIEEFIPKSFFFVFRNYSLFLFKSDLIAGVTVGVVALPLAMAFAIASGVSPEQGLYTAIIAGFLISLLGGSRLQIGGPTGAFVVIIYDIVTRGGYEYLVVVTLIAGVILLIAAFSKLGSLIKYIPYPLITGFTTGIAVIIFSSQVKNFLGLQISNLPASFIPKWSIMLSALPSMHLQTFLIALGTLILILIIRKYFPFLPWGIISVVIMTTVSTALHLEIETIFSRFGEIKGSFPRPTWPSFSSFTSIHLLLPDAITIAFLAGVESLLSAVVADGLASTRHKSNCELMGQGIANICSVLFGGIPATGAIARTATNIKVGAKTPLAGMIHAITLLVIMLFCGPVVSKIPLACLSAVLVVVAWNMSELHHFVHLMKAPKGDVVVLLTTFFLTVLVDLTVAVQIGMILAAFLFMKKMKDMTKVGSIDRLEQEYSSNMVRPNWLELKQQLPSSVEIYEITGPFFFGVADSLKNVLANLERPPKVFILVMEDVPMIDASGMHALQDFYHQSRKDNTQLVIVGATKPVLRYMKKYKLLDIVGEKHIFAHLKDAIAFAKESI
ncbi:MAG: sulfate permease [Chlamydiales bacterium]|nr:sulfate permease [Chlamydiales bacterium]